MTPPTRVAWLDLARAVSIVLVVMYHVGVGANTELLGGPDRSAARWWSEANLALVPLRMPLFFAISGVLAAGALHRPWSRVLRPRILDLLWPYLLWSMIFAITGFPRYAPDDPGGFVLEELRGLLMIASPYWFIAALPIFFLLTRLSRSRPRLAVALALVAYAVSPFLEEAMRGRQLHPDLIYGVWKLTDNLLWYTLGYAARAWILRLGERARLGPGLLLAAVFALLALTVLRADLPLGALRALELVASVSGLLACVLIFPLLTRRRSLARAGEHLGSRTLVIYLVHPVVINVLVLLWRDGEIESGAAALARDVLMVPAAAALAVAVALLLDAVVTRFGPRWLFSAPSGHEMHNTMQARRSSS